MNEPDSPLSCVVCFAVREEARPFRARARGLSGARVLITGMGKRNARERATAWLETHRVSLALTAGFAGGLNPDLSLGDVIYSVDPAFPHTDALRRAGARPGRFACLDRVASTASEKSGLWKDGGWDAAEMESGEIREVCRERGVPSATVRVVLDAAGEDLPLDFNRVFTARRRIHPAKLAACLAARPSALFKLWRFRRSTRLAADRLAIALDDFLRISGVDRDSGSNKG